jgi:Mn-containing catalase
MSEMEMIADMINNAVIKAAEKKVNDEAIKAVIEQRKREEEQTGQTTIIRAFTTSEDCVGVNLSGTGVEIMAAFVACVHSMKSMFREKNLDFVWEAFSALVLKEMITGREGGDQK